MEKVNKTGGWEMDDGEDKYEECSKVETPSSKDGELPIPYPAGLARSGTTLCGECHLHHRLPHRLRWTDNPPASRTAG
jgi:hypothetical protein